MEFNVIKYYNLLKLNKISYNLISILRGLELEKNNGNANTEVLSVNIKKALKEQLRDHFEDMGLDLSGGVRMVLIRYLNSNGVTNKDA